MAGESDRHSADERFFLGYYPFRLLAHVADMVDPDPSDAEREVEEGLLSLDSALKRLDVGPRERARVDQLIRLIDHILQQIRSDEFSRPAQSLVATTELCTKQDSAIEEHPPEVELGEAGLAPTHPNIVEFFEVQPPAIAQAWENSLVRHGDGNVRWLEPYQEDVLRFLYRARARQVYAGWSQVWRIIDLLNRWPELATDREGVFQAGRTLGWAQWEAACPLCRAFVGSLPQSLQQMPGDTLEGRVPTLEELYRQFITEQNEKERQILLDAETRTPPPPAGGDSYDPACNRDACNRNKAEVNPHRADRRKTEDAPSTLRIHREGNGTTLTSPELWPEFLARWIHELAEQITEELSSVQETEPDHLEEKLRAILLVFHWHQAKEGSIPNKRIQPLWQAAYRDGRLNIEPPDSKNTIQAATKYLVNKAGLLSRAQPNGPAYLTSAGKKRARQIEQSGNVP